MEEENEYVIKEIEYGNQDNNTVNNDEEAARKESDEPTDTNEETIIEEAHKLSHKREIIQDGFGMIPMMDGDNVSETTVYRFTLTNSRGVTVQLITYGATITSIMTPDKKGHFDDIVLGYENIEGYRNPNNPYFGATVGRVTGIIPDSCFTIKDQEYDLSSNFFDNHHVNGGFNGFDKVIWQPHIEGKKLILSYMSKNGEEGFPGDILVNRSFELTSSNELIIITTATCTKPTLIDVSTHVDWNLASNLAGPSELYNHYLMVNADRYAQKDENYMPTGKLKKVSGTVMDFRIPRLLGKLIHKVPGGGYDNYLTLTNSTCKSVSFAAKLFHPVSGRFLEVLTDQPGLTIYSGNKLFAKKCYTFGHPESYWSFKYVPPDNQTKKSGSFSEENENRKSKRLSGEGEEGEGNERMNSVGGQRKTIELEAQTESDEKEKHHSGENLHEGGDEEGKVNPMEPNDHGEEIVENKTEEEEEEEPVKGKMGIIYERHGGIRLVPHSYSLIHLKRNSQNKHALKPGMTYTSTTIFKFGVLAEKKPNLAEIV